MKKIYMTLGALITAYDAGSDTSSEQEYFAVWDTYQDNLAKFKSRLRSLDENSKIEVHLVGPTATPKLPVTKLPTFSGDHTEYESVY